MLTLASLTGVAQTQDKEKKRDCMSHLKQLGLASLMYAQDYDERFAPVHHPKSDLYWWGRVEPGKGVDSTQGFLWPYVLSGTVFLCPSWPNGVRKEANLVGYAYNYRYVGGSYGVTKSDEENEKNALAATNQELTHPSRTILFADSARWNVFTEGKKPFLEENLYLDPPSQKYPTFHARHEQKGNVLFADGHVETASVIGGNRDEKVKDAPPELGHLPQEWFER
jgi:prepilin-type processing-associated H-X9-DG protein